MKITDIVSVGENGQIDISKAVDQLKSKRLTKQPDIANFKKQLDPKQHDVFDPRKRPDKWVKVDASDPNSIKYRQITQYDEGYPDSDDRASGDLRREKVARVAIAIQKLIVKRAVSFVFGNPVELDATPDGDNEKAVLKALKRIQYDIKERSFNRKAARNLFSCTEVAEYWYPVEKLNTTYGFKSKHKLRCAIFSPLLGDILYPCFDETGDMIAFSREFVRSENNKSITYFETYTDEEHMMFKQASNGYETVEGYPKEIILGKIPIVYGSQDQVEWEDVQNIIDRLEKLLSNFADTNDYHASPKIVVKGELTGFAKKGEAGAILQLEGEDASANYLSWQNAPESVKLEIETLLNFIYTITQTPDISFDAVNGIGAVSGIALKLLFMDAHLKVADHQEVLDEYLQRRINIQKAFIATMNKTLANDADDLMVTPEITPYIIRDEAAEVKVWIDSNGGNPVMSQKASFQKAAMTSDPEADFEQYQKEQNAASTFSLNEPTLP